MMTACPVRRLAEMLIRQPSVTPNDAGCQAMLTQQLASSGFIAEPMQFGTVSNLWLRRGNGTPLLVFAGHTDVVPPGPREHWDSDPFTPSERGGLLYGRGAADMKSSIAAFVVGAREFVRARPQHQGSIALLITSDEEGPAVDGTAKMCTVLQERNEMPDFCIVGEPTSVSELGDTIKNGRRGSLSGRLKVRGLQGHVAYPHLARNAIHMLAPALTELVSHSWDPGNEHFPPTTFQVSNLYAGTGAGNVIPGEAVMDFNFRFSTESTPEALKSAVQSVLGTYGLDYQLDWTLGGQPFLTPEGRLSAALAEAIEAETGVTAALSTSGGTSDGRFIAQICPEVIEFGPVNASIHQVNEHIRIDDLQPLKNIYRRTLEALLPDA